MMGQVKLYDIRSQRSAKDAMVHSPKGPLEMVENPLGLLQGRIRRVTYAFSYYKARHILNCFHLGGLNHAFSGICFLIHKYK